MRRTRQTMKNSAHETVFNRSLIEYLSISTRFLFFDEYQWLGLMLEWLHYHQIKEYLIHRQLLTISSSRTLLNELKQPSSPCHSMDHGTTFLPSLPAFNRGIPSKHR